MKIMGLDISTNCGVAHGDSGGRPHCSTLKLPGLDDANLARSCGGLYSSVLALIRANGIQGVVIEAPLIGLTRKNKRGITTPTSAHGDRTLTMLSGAAQAAVSNAGAKILGMPAPTTWRKAVFGNGYPSDPKAAAIEYCRLVWKITLTDHNSAEALCLMSWGMAQAKLL